ncbi:MAG TPA: histidinol phosphate phosphatase domain-containing protein [bacterium]|nr:histidinol phosphate phosphatase domain-containing protein [bacterium]
MVTNGLTDFHTHTLHSDGELLPAELVARAAVNGYAVVGLADHADASNFAEVIAAARETAAAWNGIRGGIRVIPGVELTYVPPAQLADMAAVCRAAGAVLIVVHGESPVEPVPAGTNDAALAADIDILAHPGLITPAQAQRAAQRGIALELTTRGGHSLTNGHVAKLARAAGAPLVLDTDAHRIDDLLTAALAEQTLRGAGLTPAQAAAVLRHNARLAAQLLRRWAQSERDA